VKKINSNRGVLLHIDLTNNQVETMQVSENDIRLYLGGRGLGIKLLMDFLKKPGVDPFSPENPLIFLPGLMSGYPIPSASRVCIVTKSPCTSPRKGRDLPAKHTSTLTYTNMGGFFGPEIKFAGYDGIIITGQAPQPVCLVIEDDRVDIKSAEKYWGMITDRFDKQFTRDLCDWDFKTCYIGPAGENRVPFSNILHTASRAAGRGGAGCIMGVKNLKAIAIKGTRTPPVFDPDELFRRSERARQYFNGLSTGYLLKNIFRKKGTAFLIEKKSESGSLAVKNFREGTFAHADKIGFKAAQAKVWMRSSACYCCPLACKKNGVAIKGKYKGIVHDGPEFETGTMFGANLLVSDLEGILKSITDGDDYGVDIISMGNVIGFLMEAYEKKLIDRKFLDGIDLTWGNVEAVRQIIRKTALQEGVGQEAARGVKYLAEIIGQDSEEFAMHVKGKELAAWNIHADPAKSICYATSNRGACHQNGDTVAIQNFRAMVDSLNICRFATDNGKSMAPGLDSEVLAGLLEPITGTTWSAKDLVKAGERIFNLEKIFNYREGFRREDDNLPDRFFNEPLTVGPEKDKVIDRGQFEKELDAYYTERDWDPITSKPKGTKLKELSIDKYKIADKGLS
jgi:aldehyde:ferredoxin oxidoreductase